MARLLESMSQYLYPITDQSPQFTSGLTFHVVQAMGLDKRLMTCIPYHLSTINSFLNLLYHLLKLDLLMKD